MAKGDFLQRRIEQSRGGGMNLESRLFQAKGRLSLGKLMRSVSADNAEILTER